MSSLSSCCKFEDILSGHGNGPPEQSNEHVVQEQKCTLNPSKIYRFIWNQVVRRLNSKAFDAPKYD